MARLRSVDVETAGQRQPFLARADDDVLADIDETGTRGITGGQTDRRHLGLFSTALLLINRMIGAAIFSIPSSIVQSVGSVGATLSLWLVGFILAYCGMFVWLELGSVMPCSGGEKLYLERAYPWPYRLASTLYGFYIMFAFTGLACVVVAENLLLAFDVSTSDDRKRALSLGVLALIAALHISSRVWSVRIMNSLGVIKIFILVLVILTGAASLCGLVSTVPDPIRSFRHPFAGSSTNINAYTTALFKVLATFQGWNNAAYVLDEVKNPRRTLKLSGVLGVGVVGLLYLLTNVCYFIVATPEEISQTGVQVVAILLGKVFGSGVQQLTATLAALSTFGSLMTTAFAVSRVAQGLAKEDVIPAAGFFAKETQLGTPGRAFLLIFLGSVVAIALVPFGDAYIFLTDVNQYEIALINFFVALGLFRVRRMSLRTRNHFRAWTVVPYAFLLCQIYLLLSPFLRPEAGRSDTSLPYMLAPLTALSACGVGGLYWWRRHETTGLDGIRSTAAQATPPIQAD